MKRLVVALIVVGPLLAVLPGAQAASEPVPGVRALVTQGGDPAFVQVRFPFASDDPDQTNGSYTYNITLDAGSGWVQVATDVDATETGFGLALIEFGGSTFEGEFNVTADDGTGPVDSVCTVTIDTAITSDYGVCGSLDNASTYPQIFCLPTTATETGFNYDDKLEQVDGTNILYDSALFGSVPSRLAVGALNLGGDTGSLRLDFDHFFSQDGEVGEFHVFFSEVQAGVGSETLGNGLNTGSFRDGWGLYLKEDGNDYQAEVVRVASGSVLSQVEKSGLAAGEANSFTEASFTIDVDADLAIFTLGTDSFAVSASGNKDPTNLWALWTAEGYNQGNSKGVIRDGDSFCLSSPDGAAQIGLTRGQEIEGFEGEGGVGGDPAFPGIDVQANADRLGVDSAAFAYVMAAFAIVGLMLFGFMVGGTMGGGLGAVLGVAASAVFNLIPLWLIVLVFLLATVIVVLGVSRG